MKFLFGKGSYDSFGAHINKYGVQGMFVISCKHHAALFGNIFPAGNYRPVYEPKQRLTDESYEFV